MFVQFLIHCLKNSRLFQLEQLISWISDLNSIQPTLKLLLGVSSSWAHYHCPLKPGNVVTCDCQSGITKSLLSLVIFNNDLCSPLTICHDVLVLKQTCFIGYMGEKNSMQIPLPKPPHFCRSNVISEFCKNLDT